MAASWWRRPQHAACWRAGMARSSSPARRRASRAMRARSPSPWASSAYAGWRRALPANWRRRTSMVGHFVIDGGIGQPGDPRAGGRGPDSLLDPNAIAEEYLHLHRQHRSAWTWEVELRPWVETF